MAYLSLRASTVVCIAVTFWSHVALAASTADRVAFEWFKGEDTPVCVAYKAYIDSLQDPLDRRGGRAWQLKPMCARTIPESFSNFVQPAWREISPANYGTMLISVSTSIERIELTAATATPKYLEATLSGLTANHKRGVYQFFLAKADINNDGKTEKLVKWRKGRCNNVWPDSLRYSIPIVVLDSQDQVDRELSRQVLNQGAYPGLVIGTSSFDVFQYSGKTYVDRWENEGEDQGKATDDKYLSVFLHERDRTTLVCKFHF